MLLDAICLKFNPFLLIRATICVISRKVEFSCIFSNPKTLSHSLVHLTRECWETSKSFWVTIIRYKRSDCRVQSGSIIHTLLGRLWWIFKTLFDLLETFLSLRRFILLSTKSLVLCCVKLLQVRLVETSWPFHFLLSVRSRVSCCGPFMVNVRSASLRILKNLIARNS
jgi:hypothetical protein